MQVTWCDESQSAGWFASCITCLYLQSGNCNLIGSDIVMDDSVILTSCISLNGVQRILV